MTKTYVVIDYDYVEYAGTKLADAKKKVKDLGCIQIWQNGKMTGYSVVYKGNQWITHYYTIATPQ